MGNIDKGMQSYKKIYSIVTKVSRFFALHFFANDLGRLRKGGGRKIDLISLLHYELS